MADKLLYQLLIEKNQLAKDLSDSIKKNAKLEADLKKTGKTGSDALKKVNKEAKGLKAVLGSTNAIDLAKGFIGANIAISAVQSIRRELVETFNRARTFGKGLAEINSILPETGKLTRQTVKELKAFSREFGSDRAEQAKAFYAVVSAGIKGTDRQLKTLSASNKAAIAGIVGIESSTKLLVSSVNAYAKSGLTATTASDSLFAAVREGQTTFGELSDFLGNTTSVAAAAGLEFSELAGFLAFVTKAGIKTDLAVTGIRQVMVALIKPTSEAKRTARELGLEFSTGALRAKGLAKFLEDVKTATGGSEQALAKLFGNVRALGPVLSVVNGNFNDFKRILDETKNSAGDTDRAFKEISKNNIDLDTSKASQKISGFTDFIFSIFKPAVQGAINLTGDLFEALNPEADTRTLKEITEEIINLKNELKGFEGSVITDVTSFAGSESAKAQLSILLDVQKQLIRNQQISAKDALLGIDRKLDSTEEIKDPGQSAEVIFERDRNALILSIQKERFEKEKELRELQDGAEFETAGDKIKRLQEQLTTENEIRDLARQENAALELEGQTQLTKAEEDFQSKRRQSLIKDQIAEAKILKSSRDAEEAFGKQLTALKRKEFAARANIAIAGANLGAAVAKEGSKAQFIIQKGAAIAGSIVATLLASAQALASPPGPPATIPLATSVKITGGLNTAAIAATAIKGFQEGGVFDSISKTGDNNIASFNGGEMFLTREQQGQLFEIAKGNTSTDNRDDSTPKMISINIDGREIARAVIEQRKQGVAV